jgi:protein phosphatase
VKFDCAFASDPGPRVENQDAVGCWTPIDNMAGLAVADGLGGHLGGQVAACMAIDKFGANVLPNNYRALPQIAMDIHHDIRAKQLGSPELRGMATTLSAIVVDRSHDGMSALGRFVHCGDTRIALQRRSGIRKLTVEHSEAQRLLTEGLLSKEDFMSYPRRNILDSALGIKGVPRIDYEQIVLGPGDKIIITSDGIHNKLFLREMLKYLEEGDTAKIFVERILSEVKSREPDDNMSIAAMFIS